ncbi:MAG: flagellar basal body protein [Tepidisphaeraceae bacterium]
MEIYGIAASGLQAAQTRMNVAANNIANLGAPGDDPQEGYLSETPAQAAVDDINPTNRPLDLATETLAQKQAALLYGASAIVIKTADQMYGSLLNVLDTDNNHYNSDGSAKF